MRLLQNYQAMQIQLTLCKVHGFLDSMREYNHIHDIGELHVINASFINAWFKRHHLVPGKKNKCIITKGNTHSPRPIPAINKSWPHFNNIKNYKYTYLNRGFLVNCLPGLFSPYRVKRKQCPCHSAPGSSNRRLRAGSSGEKLCSMILPSETFVVNIYCRRQGTGFIFVNAVHVTYHTQSICSVVIALTIHVHAKLLWTAAMCCITQEVLQSILHVRLLCMRVPEQKRNPMPNVNWTMCILKLTVEW